MRVGGLCVCVDRDGRPIRGAALLAWIVLLAGLLLAPPSAQAAGDLRLSVDPGRVNAGERTCFDARVTRDGGVPVGGAQVYLADAEKATGRDGEASLCARLTYPGIHVANAFKGGRQGAVEIRARKAGLGSGASWHRIDLHLSAWGGGDAGCEPRGATWGQVGGICWAPPASSDTAPFPNTRTEIGWPQGTPSFRAEISARRGNGDRVAALAGWVPSRNSGLYTIADGMLVDPVAGPVKVTGGTDAAKVGQPGGPLFIDVRSHGSEFSFDWGYAFHVTGYLYYDAP